MQAWPQMMTPQNRLTDLRQLTINTVYLWCYAESRLGRTEIMRATLHYIWLATRRHRFRPWNSPYICWRIETYSGKPAEEIGLAYFWSFVWHERGQLLRFLGWCRQMRQYRQATRRPWQSAFAGPEEMLTLQ